MLLAVAVAISTAVMVGAMLVGHSMRASLQQSTDSRLGQVQASLSAGDRFLSHDLVKRFQTKYRNMAGMIQLPGTLRNQETGRGLNRVTVNAVDRDFWSMSPGSKKFSKKDIAINSTLAKRLNLNVGDLILLKLSTNPLPCVVPRLLVILHPRPPPNFALYLPPVVKIVCFMIY